MLMTSSKPNYLPKASPTNTITLKIRASAHTFWRGTNIQPEKKKKIEE
jgi:ribosomal protein L31